MYPIRASIVGLLRSTASISSEIAACHSGAADFLLRQFGDVGGGVAQRDERAPVRQHDRILKTLVGPASETGIP